MAPLGSRALGHGGMVLVMDPQSLVCPLIALMHACDVRSVTTAEARVHGRSMRAQDSIGFPGCE